MVARDGDPITPVTSGSWGDGQVLGITATCGTGKTFYGWGISGDYGRIANQDAATTTYTVGANNVVITAYCGGGTMQNVTAASCTTTPSIVIDSRDNQKYTIARLADGNCWMTSNLNLGATDISVNLDSTNTNISTTISAATFNGWKKSSGSGSFINPEYIPVSGTDSTSGTPYGTLYNFCAVSANTYCFPNENVDHGNAISDICPKGWRLPVGGSSSEFAALYSLSNYNTLAKMRAPIADGGAAFALAGYFYQSTPAEQGDHGRYWTSTRSGKGDMYGLRLQLTGVDSDYGTNRSYGRSIRCVLD